MLPGFFMRGHDERIGQVRRPDARHDRRARPATSYPTPLELTPERRQNRDRGIWKPASRSRQHRRSLALVSRLEAMATPICAYALYGRFWAC